MISEGAALAKLVHQYANVPMSLADACLVRLAKLERVLKLRGVLRRGILAAAKAARNAHPQRGL